MLLVLRMSMTWSCHFNEDQAFVRADLNEDVFMRLPEGCGALSGNIVKLNKSPYGLRQASRQWYAMLKCLLVFWGMQNGPVVLELHFRGGQ